MSLSTEESDSLFEQIDNLNSQLIAANQRYLDLQQVCDGQATQITALDDIAIQETRKEIEFLRAKCQDQAQTIQTLQARLVMMAEPSSQYHDIDGEIITLPQAIQQRDMARDALKKLKRED